MNDKERKAIASLLLTENGEQACKNFLCACDVLMWNVDVKIRDLKNSDVFVSKSYFKQNVYGDINIVGVAKRVLQGTTDTNTTIYTLCKSPHEASYLKEQILAPRYYKVELTKYSENGAIKTTMYLNESQFNSVTTDISTSVIYTRLFYSEYLQNKLIHLENLLKSDTNDTPCSIRDDVLELCYSVLDSPYNIVIPPMCDAILQQDIVRQ